MKNSALLVIVTCCLSFSAFADTVDLVIEAKGQTRDMGNSKRLKEQALRVAITRANEKCTQNFGGTLGLTGEDVTSNVCVTSIDEEWAGHGRVRSAGVKILTAEVKVYCRVERKKISAIKAWYYEGDGAAFRDCTQRISAQNYLN